MIESFAAVVIALAVVWVFWRGFKRALSEAAFGDPGPYSVESPEEALYRAKRRRRLAEHESWDSEFAVLVPGCPVCGGRNRSAHSHAARRVPFM